MERLALFALPAAVIAGLLLIAAQHLAAIEAAIRAVAP